ncbi:MAG: 50S ribosomal protein L11 methyltransferase [Gemmatimonadota bacterium]
MSGTERRWLELRTRSPAGGETGDLLAEGLVALGGRAVEERDGWFVTHVPEPDDPEGFEAVALARLRDTSGLDDVEVEVSWRAHEDWAETWRRGLAPRRLTERLVVRPSWTEVPDPRDGDLVIVLDPGMAFGTAEHGTTRGCLRLLDRAVEPGDRTLDVGAGSGILSIAAVLLGASDVHAVEADPLACEAIAENIARNGVPDRVRWTARFADVAWLEAEGPVSGIVANIESGVLTPLLPGFAAAIEPGGWLILSGILDHEWPAMRQATEDRGFELVEVDADGAWRSGLFRLGRHAT